MIERVSGKIIDINPSFCVLDCHGIGIGLHISLNTFQQLESGDAAENAALHSYLHVREDALQLFGFFDKAERQYFELLISISGVGPKLALAVLSGCSPEALRSAIATENVGILTTISGVGKKTAQRIILELKGKIARLPEGDAVASMPVAAVKGRDTIEEAVLALMELGYKQPDARKMIETAVREHGDNLTVEDMIRFAL